MEQLNTHKSARILLFGDNLTGGGKVLYDGILDEILLNAAKTKHTNYTFFSISEQATNYPPNATITNIVLRGSRRFGFVNRILQRKELANKLPNSTILNFTNFPIPFLAKKSQLQYILIHNSYLVVPIRTLIGLQPIGKLFVTILKRAAFKILVRTNGNKVYLFQTKWVYDQFNRNVRGNAKCLVLPKHRSLISAEIRAQEPLEDKGYWLYPAAPEPHKCHLKLIELATYAKRHNRKFTILVTLPLTHSYSQRLVNEIKVRKLEDYFLNVEWVSSNQLITIFKSARGLLFPSIFESLGLPLLEARDLHLPVLAEDTDLNREVLENNYCLVKFEEKNWENIISILTKARSELGKLESNLSIAPVTLFEAYIKTPLESGCN